MPFYPPLCDTFTNVAKLLCFFLFIFSVDFLMKFFSYNKYIVVCVSVCLKLMCLFVFSIQIINQRNSNENKIQTLSLNQLLTEHICVCVRVWLANNRKITFANFTQEKKKRKKPMSFFENFFQLVLCNLLYFWSIVFAASSLNAAHTRTKECSKKRLHCKRGHNVRFLL